MGDIGSPRSERDPAELPVATEPAQLREALRRGAPPQRVAAIRSAVPAPGLEAVLEEALSDPEPSVRAAAAQALGRVGRSRAIRALIRTASEDPSAAVRSEAVAALAERLTGPKRQRPPTTGRPV